MALQLFVKQGTKYREGGKIFSQIYASDKDKESD
jgi:hypothetical protein